MKTHRDRPPVVLFLVLLVGMIAVALGLAALDAPPPMHAAAAASQDAQQSSHSADRGAAPSEPNRDRR